MTKPKLSARDKAKLAARYEVYRLLRRAGKQPLDTSQLEQLIEDVCLAVGLNQKRVNRLLVRVVKAIAHTGDLQLGVGDTLLTEKGPGVITKLTKKMVYLQVKSKVQRIARAKLIITPSVVIASKSPEEITAPSVLQAILADSQPLESEG